jgi:hypothetical protein
MRIDNILKAAAKRMVGVNVECDSAFSTVLISAHGEDDIFMQGYEADAFIQSVEDMGARCKCLSPAIIELALAEPYTDLWS